MATPPFQPLDALARQAATAPVRADQLRALDDLIARTYPTPATLAAFHLLRSTPTVGTKLALEFVARMPEPIPAALLPLAAQLIEVRTTPVQLRLAVAGKLLASQPDTPNAARPIIRSVTAGLSKSRRLERMIQLQSRVETCAVLDEMVRNGERRVKWKCPKCAAKLARREFIRHLWAEHRLRFDRGTAYDPRGTVESAVNAAAAGTSPEAVESAFTATRFYFPEASFAQVLQGVAARQRLVGSPLPPALLKAAEDQKAGLCPSCLTAIPDPIPPLPPPLASGSGRLAGDGYEVQVTETSLGQTATAETPAGPVPLGPDARRFGPRGLAVLVTAPLLALVLLVVLPFPRRLASPGWVAVGLSSAAWVLYYAVRSARAPLPSPDDRAVEIAWESLAPTVGRSRKAVRFLTRLCRASAGVGATVDRVPKVWQWVEQAEVLAEKSADHAQFLAAVQALQAFDGVTFGKDKLGGLAVAFGRFTRGEAGAGYAEAMAEFALTSGQLTAGESARLAVALTAESFDAGLLPGDLAAVVRQLPWVRRLLGRPTATVLQHRYAIWRGRNSEPWSPVGKAASVFELVASAPSTARRILATHPDALLKIDLPDGADRDLGDTVMTPRGVIVGGKVLTDPDGGFSLARSPSGSGWWLVLGAEKITLDRRLTPDVATAVRAWVRYWATKQVPQAEAADRTNPARVAKLLAAVKVTCPLCGTVCACRAGRVADPWPLA